MRKLIQYLRVQMPTHKWGNFVEAVQKLCGPGQGDISITELANRHMIVTTDYQLRLTLDGEEVPFDDKLEPEFHSSQEALAVAQGWLEENADRVIGRKVSIGLSVVRTTEQPDPNSYSWSMSLKEVAPGHLLLLKDGRRVIRVNAEAGVAPGFAAVLELGTGHIMHLDENLEGTTLVVVD